MLISKMNRFIEKHGTAALIILALALIIPLVFTWMPGQNMWGGGGRGVKASKYVGKMYGKKLRRDELYRNIYAVELPVFLMYGRWMHEDGDRYEDLRDAALDRIRMVREARRLGLDKDVTAVEVDDRLRMMFSAPGQGFSPETYDAFVANVLPRLGLGEADLTELIRESLMVEKLRGEVTDSVVVSDEEADEENRAQLATYTCRQAVFKHADYIAEVKLVSDADVEAYFEQHKGTLRLPDMRKVALAEFSVDQFGKDVTIDDAAVKAYYTERKEGYDRQNKAFEDVQASIRKLLTSQEQRRQATQAAEDFVARLRQADDGDLAAAEAFARTCKASGVEMKTSGAFSTFSQDDIEGFPKPRATRLVDAALALGESQPFSDPVYHLNAYYVLALAETIPGGQAETLTDELKASLKAELETAVAREYYNTYIAPFQELLKGMESARDLAARFDAGELTGKLPEVAADMDAEDFRQFVSEKLAPFFNETKKRAAVVVFNRDDFMGQVEGATEADIQAAYDKNKSQYAAQVKASHILLKTDGMDDEAKAAQKAKLAELQKQLQEGKSFEDLARGNSECPSSSRGGDLGFFGRGQMVKPFEDAAFALEKGAVSDIVETRFGYHLIKVADTKPEKSIDDVRDELIETVKAEKALALARTAADDFAYGAYDAVMGRDEKTTAAEAFEALARQRNVKVENTRWFESRGFTQPFAGDFKAVTDAFKVSEEDPVSSVIAGKTKMYVACWAGTILGVLPDFDGEPATVTRVNSILTKERAVAMARAAAEKAAETLNAKLKEGEDFKTAAADVQFADIADFTLSEPPTDTNGALIVETAKVCETGTVSQPVDIPLGALLVYVAAKTPVTDEVLAEKREATRMKLLREKQQEEFDTFRRELEKASETVLDEA